MFVAWAAAGTFLPIGEAASMMLHQMLGKPNIIIIGVGHSGTSLLAKMLFTLGWESNDADEVFCESVGLREINDNYRSENTPADIDEIAREFLAGLKTPFALKDPRLSFTLPLWKKAAANFETPPLLLRISRARADVARSYLDRGELFQGGPGMYGRTLDQLIDCVAENFAEWPHAKFDISYEAILAAARLVKPVRKMRAEGGLWVTDSEG